MTTEEVEALRRVLPDHAVGSVLGGSTVGVVLSGTRLATGAPVAIKVLRPSYARLPGVDQRFASHAERLTRLRHANLVELHDYRAADGVCALVMERLEGGSLRDRLSLGPIPAPSACALAVVICSALDFAHSHGMLHGDLKPNNVLFDSSGGALKLTDLGIVEVVARADRPDAIGSFPGTVAYLAPEQIAGDPIGPGVDVYAMATLLYEMLAGQLPFSEDGSDLAIAHSHLYSTPRPLSEVVPALPQPLVQVIMTGLARDPDDRQQSARELGAAIADAADAAFGAIGLDDALRPPSTGQAPAALTVDEPPPSAAQKPDYSTPTAPADASSEIRGFELGGARMPLDAGRTPEDPDRSDDTEPPWAWLQPVDADAVTAPAGDPLATRLADSPSGSGQPAEQPAQATADRTSASSGRVGPRVRLIALAVVVLVVLTAVAVRALDHGQPVAEQTVAPIPASSSQAPTPGLTTTCWNGGRVPSLAGCEAPSGTAELVWMFPSISKGCDRRPRSANDERETIVCPLEVSGRTGHVRYSVWREHAEAVDHYQTDFGTRPTNWLIDGSDTGLLWQDDQPRQDADYPYKAAAVYRDLPLSFSVYAQSKAELQTVLDTIVQARPPGDLRGTTSG